MDDMDIADDVFLAAVAEAMRVREEVDGPPVHWATRWDVAAILAGHPEHVGGNPQDYPEVPEEAVMAKARELGRRGLLHGCEDDGCNCRGDYELA